MPFHRQIVALTTTLLLATAAGADDLSLALPLDCDLGVTCHIQQFMDRDPGPGVRDFRCGGLSYDGHRGTDFALPTLADMTRGVDVLAAAPGRVRATRDEMPDRLFDPEDADALAGRDCGNGVVIVHDGGYETQYCHMKRGSIIVSAGAMVDTGTVLGQVGLSGRTQFPHVHISVRRNGQDIDPFDRDMTESCAPGDADLWADPAPQYRTGALLDAGFASAIPDYGAVRDGTAAQSTLRTDAGALVLFGFAFGGQQGDVIAFQITGPDGEIIAQEVTLDRDQAQFFRAVGKRLRGSGWPVGQYTGMVDFRRGSELIDQRRIEITVE